MATDSQNFPHQHCITLPVLLRQNFALWYSTTHAFQNNFLHTKLMFIPYCYLNICMQGLTFSKFPILVITEEDQLGWDTFDVSGRDQHPITHICSCHLSSSQSLTHFGCDLHPSILCSLTKLLIISSRITVSPWGRMSQTRWNTLSFNWKYKLRSSFSDKLATK